MPSGYTWQNPTHVLGSGTAAGNMRQCCLPNPNVPLRTCKSMAPSYPRGHICRLTDTWLAPPYRSNSELLNCSDGMKLLDASIKALELARLVAAEVPVPGLSIAVECALNIALKAKVSMHSSRSHHQFVVTRIFFRISKTLETTAELSPSVSLTLC